MYLREMYIYMFRVSDDRSVGLDVSVYQHCNASNHRVSHGKCKSMTWLKFSRFCVPRRPFRHTFETTMSLRHLTREDCLRTRDDVKMCVWWKQECALVKRNNNGRMRAVLRRAPLYNVDHYGHAATWKVWVNDHEPLDYDCLFKYQRC